ncbi:MAG: phage head morphogenesis protein [Clostridia bacterium]|nr:phage head morphogenesis protein [Clostridia bacterium]
MEENIFKKFVNDLMQNKSIRGFSENWANWMSVISATTCEKCLEGHGTIAPASILEGQFEKPVNAHENCKCKWVRMRTKKVGTATNMGNNGVDCILFYYNYLPNYYITKEEASSKGWKPKKGNLSEVCPNKVIGGNPYKNKNKKLPTASNRIWYEADINYEDDKRNRQRILYSNDGLLFVTYDHYETFYEITA